MAAEIVNGILSRIGEYLLEAVIQQVGYVFRFKSKIKDLKKEDETLRLVLDRVQNEVDRAQRNTEEVEKDVQKWLTDASIVIVDIQKLEEEIQANKTCLSGWCPNWALRYRLSKKAEDIISVISKLLGSSKFERVSHGAILPGIEFFASKDFEPFESTKATFDQIIEALKDDKINMVGIYGMGGVGKTTLAKEIGKKMKELNIFNEVVWATVSQNPIFKNIQVQIAELLSLKLEEQTDEGRARRLWLRLKKEKKILVILDDIWAKLNLMNIGIPFGDDHKGCKILLTTRRRHVCNSMGCESQIPLNVLEEEEGLALLKKNAGVVDESPTLNDLVKEVARECKGLPLAIVTIGSALKGKIIDEWKFVSQKLKNSKFVDVDDVDTDIYACLKLSYDYLKEEDAKVCFLLCSLFPEDFEIPLNDLVIYGRGIGMYKDANSIEEARGQVRVMVNNLKASGLLLDGRGEKFVKMHDVVRDVAIWIASKQEKKFMSKAGLQLREWPKEEGLEQYTAISLTFYSSRVLSVDMVLPKLEILLLNNARFTKAADQFFVEMKALKVVSVLDGNLSLKSLEFLTNLRSLQLHDCYLRDISSIGSLSSLEILSLRDSMFKELPEKLALLGKLRFLDLSGCRSLKRIPPNVINRLSQLEELYFEEYSFIEWDVEGERNASLSELNSLAHLRILFLIVEEECIPKDFIFPKLQRYGIVVCYVREHHARLAVVKTEAESFLRIMNSSSDSPLIAFQAVLQNLKYLKLWKLGESRFLWKGCNAQHLSLRNLTYVNVDLCRSLTCLFTASLAQSLVQLKTLTVDSCPRMKHIVDTDTENEVKKAFTFAGEGNHGDIVFPQLRELYLSHLDDFISFCPQNYDSKWPTLQSLKVQYCRALSSFPIAEHTLTNLREITVGYKQLWDTIQSLSWNDFKSLQYLEIRGIEVKVVFQLHSLEHELSVASLEKLELIYLDELEALYEDPAHILRLQNLSTLNLFNCPKLKHLFSTTFVRNLLQLKDLRIEGCSELEQIVVEEDEKDHTSLNDHLRLTCFSNLSTIYIAHCKKLKGLFHVTIARNLLYLEYLSIRECEELEQIIVGDDDVNEGKEITLHRLKCLHLQQLPSLFNFCPVGYHFMFPSLEELWVINCPEVTTEFSVAQNGTVHVQAKPEVAQEDVTSQLPAQSTMRIYAYTADAIRRSLPPYIENDKREN